MKKYALLLSTLIASSTVAASEIQLGLSDHTAEVIYGSEFNNRSVAEASWLYHEDDGHLLGLGFYGKGQNGAISGKLGGKLFYVDVDGPDGHGLAVGGTLAFHATRQIRLVADLHYSPSVTSFGEVEHLEQASARVVFELMDNASLFIGYRNVDVDIKRIGDVELARGGFGGLSISF